MQGHTGICLLVFSFSYFVLPLNIPCIRCWHPRKGYVDAWEKSSHRELCPQTSLQMFSPEEASFSVNCTAACLRGANSFTRKHASQCAHIVSPYGVPLLLFVSCQCVYPVCFRTSYFSSLLLICLCNVLNSSKRILRVTKEDTHTWVIRILVEVS